jgi:hypothetical protein
LWLLEGTSLLVNFTFSFAGVIVDMGVD